MKPAIKAIAKVIVSAEKFFEKVQEFRSDLFAPLDMDFSIATQTEVDAVNLAASNAEHDLISEIVNLEFKLEGAKGLGIEDILSENSTEIISNNESKARTLSENINGSLGMIINTLSELESSSSSDNGKVDFDQVVIALKKEVAELKDFTTSANTLSKVGVVVDREMMMG